MAVELSQQNISENDSNKKSIFDSDVRDCTIERYGIFVRYMECRSLSELLFGEDFSSLFTSRLLLLKIEPRSMQTTEYITSNQCVRAMIRGDIALLRILLDYEIYMHLLVTIPVGLWNSFYEESVDDYQTSRVCNDHSIDLSHWNLYVAGYFRATEFEGHIDVHLENYTCISSRRLLHVLWGLGVIRNYFNRIFNDEINRCFRLMFDFIQEPHITVSEIRDLLRYLLKDQNDTESFVNNVCGQFEEEFPECAGPYQPRSLEHLSICRIRQNMRSVGKFPQDIRSHIRKDHALRNKYFPKLFIEYILSEEYFNDSEIQYPW